MPEWVRWVRLWFLVSYGGPLGRLLSVVVWCIGIVGEVSVKSVLASHFICIRFLQSGIASFGIFLSINFNSNTTTPSLTRATWFRMPIAISTVPSRSWMLYPTE